jgi:putative endonuclease
MLSKQYYIYTLTSESNSVLYVGFTNDLKRRVYEHKNHLVEGFTSRYRINKLVYFETCSDVNSAITREKQIKKWLRRKKVELIQGDNPEWQDLYDSL